MYEWSSSPDASGRVRVHMSHDIHVYLLEHVYPGRVALTTFAPQIVYKKLISVARKAVLPVKGLHATFKKQEMVRSKAAAGHVEGVIQKYQFGR